MHEAMRRSYLTLFFVALLKITSLSGFEYDKTFYIQPQSIQFSREPDNILTLPRTDVTFVCSIKLFNGFSSDITWFYNNTIIKAGSNYKISINGQGTSMLTVRNVSAEDEGSYHCRASEWKTKIRSGSGRLYVMDTGNMSTYSDGNVTNKYNITAVYKSTVILPCYLKHDTKPVWLRNHLILNSKELNQTVLVDENGDLVLVNVSSDHSGHYQCQTNESGTIINGSSYELTVQNSMGSLDDSGKPSSQHLLIIPNNCDSSPHNQTVTLQCQVTGYPSPVISWYLNGELVNFTEYNITDNVGNNTWMIQGGNPCRLIGYWQCFATNEVGTVHNEIRVLPYGWSNPPGEPLLNVTKLNEHLSYDRHKEVISAYSSVNVSINWLPPQYLGGLNVSDIYYQSRINGDNTITTDTHSFVFYREVDFLYNKKTLNIRVTVHYNGSTVDHLYIPSNILVEKSYGNLLCDALEFRPPQISAQCYENGIAYFNWNISPDQHLSEPHLNSVLFGWFLSGNCSYPNGTNPIENYEDVKYGADDLTIENIPNGMTCTYEVRPDYDGCDCKASCQTSASCNVLYVSPTTMYASLSLVATATVALTKPLESSNTTMDSFIAATPSTVMDSNSVVITDNLIDFTTTVFTTTTTTTFASSISTTTSHFSTVIITDNHITQHTPSSFSTTTPTVTTSSGSNTSVSFFIAIGLLIILLIGSIIIFCTVLYIYRWKSTGKNADIKFLKMSQTVKMMKPPLSNNYCSTINVADESVCEIPVNKVKRWIDNNDFKQNEDVLRSESFHSLATSQMFAYIHKHDKNNNKQLSVESLDDYIDDTQMEYLESVCSNINDKVYETSNCLLSSYVDESHLNQSAYLATTNSCQCNSYCEESTAFNNLPHPNPCHNSLPDYIEESSCHTDIKTSQKCLSSISYDSLPLNHIEIPDKRYVSKDGHTSSLPTLVPCVSNPSFDLSQHSSNQTINSIQMVASNSDFHLTDKDRQKQSNKSNRSIDTSNCRLIADSRLNTGSIKALSNSEYYKLLSTSKEIDSMHSSISNLSLFDNHSDVSGDIPSSGNQTSSLGYFELPGDNSKSTFTDSGTSTRKSYLSELDFDIDSCDVATTTNASKQFNADACSPSVDLGYVHLPCQTENIEQDQHVDINDKTLDDLTMKHYIMSIENVV